MSRDKSCYNCRYRDAVPGSAHSSCRVLRGGEESAEKSADSLEILLAYGEYEITVKDNETGESSPAVKLNPHGVKNGWALWPINFDSVWVDDCVFYTEKEQIKVV